MSEVPVRIVSMMSGRCNAAAVATEFPEGQWGGAGLDVPGLVRRARRVADLSQRDLALLLGVCQATVAHWETGRRLPGLVDLEDLLRLAGLQLLVVVTQGAAQPEPALDAEGAAQPEPAVDALDALDADASPESAAPVDARGGILPMRHDAVRDNADRHYPAHLDTTPLYQVWRPRWDRPELNLHCPRRSGRDAHRARTGVTPPDHLTPDDVVATLARWREERRARLRRLLPPRPTTDPTDPPFPADRPGPADPPFPADRPGHPDRPGHGPAEDSTDALAEVGWCTCPIECEEHDGPCPDHCPCGCERPDTWAPVGAADPSESDQEW